MADGQSADVPTIAVLKAVEHSLCTYVVRTPALAHASHPAPQWGFSRYASSPRPAPAPAHPIERVACHGACFLRPHTTGHPGQAATPPCFAAASRPAAPSPPRMEARMRYMLHQCRSKRRRTAAAGGRYHEQGHRYVCRRLPRSVAAFGTRPADTARPCHKTARHRDRGHGRDSAACRRTAQAQRNPKSGRTAAALWAWPCAPLRPRVPFGRNESEVDCLSRACTAGARSKPPLRGFLVSLAHGCELSSGSLCAVLSAASIMPRILLSGLAMSELGISSRMPRPRAVPGAGQPGRRTRLATTKTMEARLA